MTGRAPSFAAQLAELESQGLLRTRRVVASAPATRIEVDGVQRTAFCSNDYLGLAQHPALIDAATTALREFGVGGTASHLISGHHASHARLEERLQAYLGRPCLVFSSGYAANTGALPALADAGDVLFCDALIHASLIDGARLSRARVERFAHNDMADLRLRLGSVSARRKLIVVDGVYSMDGDLAPLPDLLELAERHDAWLYVDDAHAFGVLGAGGRGTPAHFGLDSSRIIQLCTFGKAAGVAGAALCAEAEVVAWLVQRARSYVYSTAMPPALAAALDASLGLFADEDGRQRLAANIERFRKGCDSLPWTLLPSITPIQPLVVGDVVRVMAIAQALWEQGIWVPAIRPPTVPAGSARLRVSLSAAHTSDDVDLLIRALRRCAREC